MHRVELGLEQIFVLKTRAKTHQIFDTRTRVWDQTRVIERAESALRLFLRVFINPVSLISEIDSENPVQSNIC
jgi:hypothetical protein